MTIELCDDAAYYRLLASLGGVRHNCPQCGSHEHGRPTIGSGYLSIAHVTAIGLRHVVALADQPLGVDAERVGAGIGIDDVALHTHERQLVGQLSPDARQQAVLETWVAKEAALKLHGTGLHVAPESFVARHAAGWGVDADSLGAAPIFLTVRQIGAVVLAIATYEPVSDVGFRRTNRLRKLDC